MADPRIWQGLLVHPVLLEIDMPNGERGIIGFARGERVLLQVDGRLPSFAGQAELHEVEGIVRSLTGGH
jgi:hypothetical protein